MVVRFERREKARHHSLTARELSKENDRLFYHWTEVRRFNVFLDLSRKESQ